ncbi:MAG: FecR family protein, partial [Alphaproteobacteria bacterium]|nr:FecR family protein [Alphaproteobacteria bacterium]
MLRRVIALWLAFGVPITPAFAADWIATKLRGSAQVEINEVWSPLQRGDSVADGQLVRTLDQSQLTLMRGDNVIALGPVTQLKIDESVANGHTIIRHDFGTVDVSAEILPTEHLEVQTRYLAAVVKGTRFVVTADELGASVEVSRGLVAVTSTVTGQTTSLPAGNSAHVTAALGTIALGGITPLPVVHEPKGIDLPNSS